MLSIVLEAAFRSLLMALAVWGCVSLLRVRAVLAQKVTWVLVLLCAAAMPLVMRAPLLSMSRAVQIPLRVLPKPQQTLDAPQPRTASVLRIIKPKPNAAHRSQDREPNANAGSTALILASAPVAATTRTESVARAVDTVVASPNPPAQILQTLWQKTAAYWTLNRLTSLLIKAYLAVCGLLLLRALVGLGMAFRLWYLSSPIESLELETNPALKVRASAHLATPVTIASTVLLPANYREWDSAKLRIVLAHEQSHVRQGDFYLQLVAAVHAAIFWFSPLGWWLQSKLSDLGEALSDRAGLEQAPDAAAYAQILLEFAAIPRKHSIFQPVAGVAMARSSRLSTLSSRIDRVLDASRFRLSFLGGRRHAALAVVLVPAILIAVVAGIRFVPAVEAAQVNSPTPTPFHLVLMKALGAPSRPQAAPAAPAVPSAPAAVPALAEVAPDAPVLEAPEVDALEAPEPPAPFREKDGSSYIHVSDDDEGSFAIVTGNNSNVFISGDHQEDLEKAKKKYHGNFIWFERDGKSYVITDPALIAKAQAEFKTDPRLVLKQEQLQKMQAEIDLKMEKLKPEIEAAMKPTPEFQQEMKKLSAELAELQSEKFKKLTAEVSKEFTQEKLAELQEKIGDIQGHIGEMQGEMGERAGKMGERQGELGEQMGKIGEEMGRIGEEQGRKAEAAARRMRSVLDQAVKDGKAKPVE